MNFEKMLIKNEKKIKEKIKEEYPQGQEYFFDYRETFTKNEIQEALKYTDDYGGFRQALESIVDEGMHEQREEFYRNIEKIVIEHLNEHEGLAVNPEDPSDILVEEDLAALREFACENTEYNVNLEQLKRNTGRIEEIMIEVFPPGSASIEKYQSFGYGSFVNPQNFTRKGLEQAREEYENPNITDPINWLIQTQGYELADLYDPEKVKNSRFLESLRSELCDYTTILDNGKITFAAIGGDFESLEATVTGKENILVKPESQGYIGISNSFTGSTSGLGIELEREVVIPREWTEIEYKISPLDKAGGYTIQDICGLVDNKRKDVFRETAKQPIVVESVNMKKLEEIAERNDRIREKIEEVARKLEENPKIETAYASEGMIPEITILIAPDFGGTKEIYDLAETTARTAGLPVVNIENNSFICTLEDDGSVFMETKNPFETSILREVAEISRNTSQKLELHSKRKKETKFVFENGKIQAVSKKQGEKVSEVMLSLAAEATEEKNSVSMTQIR